METKINKYSKNGVQTQYAERPTFIDWTIQNLPAAYNFYVTDVDAIFRNRDGDLMLVEIKCNKAVMSQAQRTTYHILDTLIKKALNGKAAGVVNVRGKRMRIAYRGFRVLTFENEGFHDGKAYIDGKPMTEQEIISLFSFEKTLQQIFNERQKKIN